MDNPEHLLVRMLLLEFIYQIDSEKLKGYTLWFKLLYETATFYSLLLTWKENNSYFSRI